MAHFNEIYDEARVAIADRVIELAPEGKRNAASVPGRGVRLGSEP